MSRIHVILNAFLLHYVSHLRWQNIVLLRFQYLNLFFFCVPRLKLCCFIVVIFQ